MEEEILREKALIRAYRAELAILKHNSLLSHSTTRASEGETAATSNVASNKSNVHDEEDNFLIGMFPDHPVTFEIEDHNDSTNLSREKQECIDLTQSIQGFVFTSVESLAKPERTTPPKTTTTTTTLFATLNQPQQRMTYILRGYFPIKPSVSARIRMTTEMYSRTKLLHKKRKRTSSSSSYSSSQKERIRGLVVELNCSLESSEDEDLTYMETNLSSLSSSSSSSKLNRQSLPDWIQGVNAYLEFDKRQEECLDRWKARHGHVFHFFFQTNTSNSTNKDKNVIKSMSIQPNNCNNNNNNNAATNLPVFVWEWDWHHERDTLRYELSTSIMDSRRANGPDESGLSEQGLRDLVACTGSCEKALDVIFNSISSTLKHVV